MTTASARPRQTLSDRALLVLDRFTFGYSQDLLSQTRRFHSIDAWFAKQLTVPNGMRSAAIDGWFPHLTTDSPAQAQSNITAGTRSTWNYGQDFVAWTLARRTLSGNQVHEVMVDFWSNLLHVPANTSSTYALRFGYDQLIRTYALTTFKDLLRASVYSAAMNSFLTNYQNRSAGINENLGRELLELHSVGVDAGYTEDDVQASARLLTGFTLDFWKTWAFGYDPSRHYVGPLTVLGRTFENPTPDGRTTLDEYLDFLATHDRTAGRIAERLCTRFVCDDPPADVVAAVKAAYVASGSDVSSCLTTLLRHPRFASSAKAKVRTPVEDVVASARALGIRPTGHATTGSFLDRMSWYCDSIGQTPFSWPRPDGFPETTQVWATPARMLRSWTIHTYITSTESRPVSATMPRLSATLPSAYPVRFDTLVHHQSVLLTGRRASAATVVAAATAMGVRHSTVLKRTQVTSWLVRNVRSIILSTPANLRR